MWGMRPTRQNTSGVVVGRGQLSQLYNGGKNLGKNFFYGLEKMSYLWSGGWVSLYDVVFKGKKIYYLYMFFYLPLYKPITL
jgi:hypothetical protein